MDDFINNYKNRISTNLYLFSYYLEYDTITNTLVSRGLDGDNVIICCNPQLTKKILIAMEISINELKQRKLEHNVKLKIYSKF